MLLIVINIIFAVVVGFLAWIYYKTNQGLQFMSVLVLGFFCYLVTFEMKEGYQLIFSAGCTIICGILLSNKIARLKAEYKRKRLEEAEQTYKKYQALNKQRRKF